jgi:predicted O-methyltransferase YrrM
MFLKITSYLKHLLKSKNKHSAHSPFVFDLVTTCFNKKTTLKTHYKHLIFRKSLLANKNVIAVTDFGAGSKIFKTNLRPINKITKYAGLSIKKANSLINLVLYFKPKTILEFGTSVGLGTIALHLGNPTSKITTLEGCLNTMNIAKNQFKELNFNNIETITGEFDSTLKDLNLNTTFDLAYFDGNHQKDATLRYFQFCLQYANSNSVFVFDDIHWSKSMEEAWNEIKKHSKVKVTIDTYQWGIVFFRKEQKKEHFIIRI